MSKSKLVELPPKEDTRCGCGHFAANHLLPDKLDEWGRCNMCHCNGFWYAFVVEEMAENPYRVKFCKMVLNEVDRAYQKHRQEQWGRHEFYAILKEEVDELWDAIKEDAPQEQVEKEMIQVAAMCLRYFETRDRYRQNQEAWRNQP